jgi:hypothetical protein
MGKNHGKATMRAHTVAAAKPKGSALIKELGKNFKNWPSQVRREKLNTLLAIEGISICGLARDINVNESTLRYYVASTRHTKQVVVPRKQAPLTKPSGQIAAALRPQTVQQKATPKVSTRRRIQLPPRPQKGVSENAVHELADLLVEFLHKRAVRSEDFGIVLSHIPSLMRESPDLSNQPIGSIPTGDDRFDLFDRINTGAADCDRFYQLAVGIRNIMQELGGSRATWEEALREVPRISEELFGGLALKQQVSPLGIQPIKRPVRFLVVVPGWRQKEQR